MLEFELTTSSILILVLLALLCLFCLKFFTSATYINPPPGPRGWQGLKEILGANINDNLHEVAWKWAERYGPITFYTLFGYPVCVLNDTDITRKLFASDEFKQLTTDRPQMVVSELAWYNGKDLFFTTYDEIQKKRRALLHKAIGFYGDGVERFEVIISRELDTLMEEISRQTGKDIMMDKLLAKSILRILLILIQGDCPSGKTGDDMVKTIEKYEMVSNTLMEVQNMTALTYLPVLRKFGKYKKLCDTVLQYKKEAEQIIFHDMKESFVPGQIRGISDVLIDHRGKPKYEWLDDEHTKGFLTSLVFAGHMTTRSSLLNIFLILAHHPDIVNRIQEEIDTVIGDKKPKIRDRLDMPYTEAVILEDLRYVSQIPISSFRMSNTDIHVNGYTIPKGTQMFANQWFYHHNPQVWEDPWSFKPERFLDSEGRLLSAEHPVRKKLQPFGIGIRICPGETFARSRVFLFIVTLLQKFDLDHPVHEPLPSCDPRNNLKGVVRQPPPYKLRLNVRKRTSHSS